MHSGWRSDRYATQQIASLQIDGTHLSLSNFVDKAIDPVIQSSDRKAFTSNVGSPSIWLFNIPINGTQPEVDIGFYDQGLPY